MATAVASADATLRQLTSLRQLTPTCLSTSHVTQKDYSIKAPRMSATAGMYVGKMVLAPMVRIGTTPFRVLALRYGADLVYSEEIIDHRLLRSTRVVNKALNTIDYIDEQDESVVLRVAEEERERLVVQIGTSDANRALAVALKIEKDVAGIDVNMGCPKAFSIKGGMGAALLTQPQKVESILSLLVKHVSVPVTCKIRILSNLDATLSLLRVIESSGVAAVAVHGRTKEERPNHENHTDVIKAVVERATIPVLANGGSSNNRRNNSHESILDFWKQTGASSVMVARAAEWNPSVFSKGTSEGTWTMAEKYMALAIEFDCAYTVSKYTLQQIIGSEQTESAKGRAVLAAPTMRDLSIVFNMEEHYSSVQSRLKEASRGGQVSTASKFSREHVNASSPPMKKSRVTTSMSTKNEDNEDNEVQDDDDECVTRLFCPFVRGHYKTHEAIPKNRLIAWTRSKGLELPTYSTTQKDKTFRSVVSVAGQKFGSLSKEKNKKFSEQAAALAAIECLRKEDELIDENAPNTHQATNQDISSDENGLKTSSSNGANVPSENQLEAVFTTT